MRVRFVIANAYAMGGTVKTTLSTAAALAARGHEVEVASVRRSSHQPFFPVPAGVRLRPLTSVSSAPPGLRDLARDPRQIARAGLVRARSRLIHPQDARYRTFTLQTDLALWRYLRGQRDAVVVGTRPGINLAIARLRGPGVVTIGQEHLNLTRHRDQLKGAFREHYPRLDALVTLTPQDARAYHDLLGDRVRVLDIPNAVPPLGDFPLHGDPDARVVVAAGRLARQKGFDLLVQAWSLVAPRHPGWQLHVYGKGRLARRLRAQVAEAGLEDSVRLKGYTDRLPQVLSESSLYVLSSRFEGFPMVLLEAMGAGLPVVTFDCPTGPSEIVEDGVNGLLVERDSVAGLAGALDAAISDPDLRMRMGRAAHETSLGYSREALAERWERLFTELARQRGVTV